MRPLADIRIISLEQYGAGPYATLHLADLGAEVIKIEDPTAGGDVARYVPPFADGEDSLFFQTYNRNKSSVALDLRDPRGRAVFEDLVRVSDAVFSNLRGDVPERLGIRYADLAPINPAIVCCSLSGYGMTGPRAAEPAYDYIVQGLAGWMDLTGEPGGPPAKSGLSLVDFSAGLAATAALVAGIHSARRDGVGMDCDLSLLDTAVSMLGYVGTWQETAGYASTRTARSAHPSLVPFQNFAAADGWIVVACAKEKFWERLVETVDPSLGDDPRFATFRDRREHADVLLPLLDQVFATRPVTAWLQALTAAGVPCGPVNSLTEVAADPQVIARGGFTHVPHPEWGEIVAPASPVRVGEPSAGHRAAPGLGADTDRVLRDVLGYDDTAIRRVAGMMGG